jgi:hypothetical protein
VLLEANADPSAARTDGWTPVRIARHQGHNDIVTLLTQHLANGGGGGGGATKSKTKGFFSGFGKKKK